MLHLVVLVIAAIVAVPFVPQHAWHGGRSPVAWLVSYLGTYAITASVCYFVLGVVLFVLRFPT